MENYPELFAKTGNPWQFWNITGWDSEHLGSHPFDDFVIIQPSWQHSEAPMRAPIPNGAIALSLIIIMTAITLIGDKNE